MINARMWVFLSSRGWLENRKTICSTPVVSVFVRVETKAGYWLSAVSGSLCLHLRDQPDHQSLCVRPRVIVGRVYYNLATYLSTRSISFEGKIKRRLSRKRKARLIRTRTRTSFKSGVARTAPPWRTPSKAINAPLRPL